MSRSISRSMHQQEQAQSLIDSESDQRSSHATPLKPISYSHISTAKTIRSPLSSPNLSTMKPQVRLLPPINPALMQHQNMLLVRGIATNTSSFSSTSAFTHVNSRISCSSVDEQTTQTGIKTSKPTSSHSSSTLPQLGSSSSTIVSIQSPSANVPNPSSFLSTSQLSSSFLSSSTPPGSTRVRTSPPPRKPRPVKLSNAPPPENAYLPVPIRPPTAASLASSSRVASMDLAAAHYLPSATSMKRSAAVADLNLSQQEGDPQQDETEQSDTTASEDHDHAQRNMDCDASQPVTSTCYFQPIKASTLPDICPLQLPSTVTQQLPTNGMMEMYIPHVLFLPSNFNSPLFVSHGQCWNAGFIRQPAVRPVAVSSSSMHHHDPTRGVPDGDCMEQLDGFDDTPVLVDTNESAEFGFCLVLRNECFDSPNLNKLLIHSLTPIAQTAHSSYQAPEFSCKAGVSSDRSSSCPFLHPPPDPAPPTPTMPEQGNNSNDSKNKSSTPAPAAMAPTWFVNSASIASGHMFIRPTILFTLIHPSGDVSRNRRWMSHPQQIMDFHLNQDIQHGFMNEFDGHLLTNAFGVSRAISRSDLVSSKFLDSAGGILLRVEILHAKSYAWSIPMEATVPSNADINRFHSASNSQLRNSGLHVSHAYQLVPVSNGNSRLPPIAPDPLYSHSRRIHVHHQQQQRQPYVNASYSSLSSSSLFQHPPSPVVCVAETVVTSSHLMMHNYEFYLKLHSQLVLNRTTGEHRFRNFTVSLVLHPRHMYRLQEKEEMSIRVDATIQLQPTHCLSPSNPTNTSITQHQREREHDNAMDNMLQHHFVTLLNARNPAITLPYQFIQSSIMRSSGAVSSQSLSNFSDVQVQFHFNSVGVVWNVSHFISHCCQRKVSPMFRLHDLTWNLIVDPKSTSEPGCAAIYLQLDKTSAGAFCHGIVLVPVFTLSILHPTDSSKNIVRKFDDAAFSFDQQVFGCSSFVEQAYLYENGWFSSTSTPPTTGSLQVEVQVLSTRILRPANLSVDTPIGPHGATHAACSYEEQCQMQEPYARSEALSKNWTSLTVEHQRQSKPQVFLTHSSPLIQSQPSFVPPNASSSSSSPPLNSISSSLCAPRSQLILQQSSSRCNSQMDDLSSASPMLTPLLDYLGTHVAEEEWDSYALPVQSRRFGAGCYDVDSGLKNEARLDETASCPPPCSPPPSESMEAQQQEHIEEQTDVCERGMLSPPPPLELPPSQLSLFDIKRHHLTTTTRHGYVCIIRCSQFSDSKLPQLIGYEVDEDRLLNTFLHALHCDVEVHLNICGAEINRVFKVLSMKDFSSYDYLGVFILTHGVDSNTVYAGDGVHIAVNDIFTLFRGVECKSLAGKPKLFFVQACRGSAVDYSAREGSGVPNLNAQNNSSTPPQNGQPAPPPTSSQPPQQIEINRANIGSIPLQYALDFPNESDFLYASSCVPGYISWTNTATGSWYISALCNVLLSYWPHMHLGDILLRVNFAVSKQNKVVDRYGSVYQIAAPTFTLRKKLYLHHGARSHQLQSLAASMRGNHKAVNNSTSTSSSANSNASTHE